MDNKTRLAIIENRLDSLEKTVEKGFDEAGARRHGHVSKTNAKIDRVDRRVTDMFKEYKLDCQSIKEYTEKNFSKIWVENNAKIIAKLIITSLVLAFLALIIKERTL